MAKGVEEATMIQRVDDNYKGIDCRSSEFTGWD
jgi:hypothetical protein